LQKEKSPSLISREGKRDSDSRKVATLAGGGQEGTANYRDHGTNKGEKEKTHASHFERRLVLRQQKGGRGGKTEGDLKEGKPMNHGTKAL